MTACEEILQRLKATCDFHYRKAFRQDDSYGTRKFVWRGLLNAEAAIDSVPVGEELRRVPRR